MLANVFLCDVAIVVDKYFEKHHGVLAHFVEYFQNCMFMMVACISRVKQLEEDSLNEDKDDILQVFPEVQEEAVEDGDYKIENGPLVGYTVSEQSVAKHVLDDLNECLHGEEGLLGLLEDGQDELESNDLCSNHVVADLVVVFLLVFTFYTELDYAFKHENCVI